MIEIAGFYAGRIVELDGPELDKEKGSMKGYFDSGGSFILLVFQEDCLVVDQDVKKHLSTGMPVRVKLGERIGTLWEEKEPI